MGRRKISIAPIADDRNRSVTFVKRKNGLFKKAHELGILCSAEVAVVVFNSSGKLFEFSSADMDGILLRYTEYSGTSHEKKGPTDYFSKDADDIAKKGLGGKMTTTSDRDDEEEEEMEEAASNASVERRSSVKSAESSANGPQAQHASNHSTPYVYNTQSPPPVNASRAGSSNLQQHPYHPATYPGQQPNPYGYPQPGMAPFQGQYYANGGQPQQQQHQPMHPNQQWAYASNLPPIANSSRPQHPLANLAPHPPLQQQPSWGYPPQSTPNWGAPYGQPSYSGPGGMGGGPDLAALQAAYAASHVVPQRAPERAEGCFAQENVPTRNDETMPPPGESYDTPYQSHYSKSANSSALPSRSNSRPAPPSRSSTINSSYSAGRSMSDKPRLSLNIPDGERGNSMMNEGKLFSAEPEQVGEGEMNRHDDRGLATANSQFASDLLPSPSGFLNDICYSGYSMSGLNTAVPTNNHQSTSMSTSSTSESQRASVFTWPKAALISSTTSTPSSVPISRDSSRHMSPSSNHDQSDSNSPPLNISRQGSFQGRAPMLDAHVAPDLIRNLKRVNEEGISPSTVASSMERRIKMEEAEAAAGILGVGGVGGVGEVEHVKKSRLRTST